MKNHKYIGLQNHFKNTKFNISFYHFGINKNGLILVLFLFYNAVSIAQLVGCTDPLATNYNTSATDSNGLDYNLSNESLRIFTQKLHQLSLMPFLGNYINYLSVKNPFTNSDLENKSYEVINLNGKSIKKGQLSKNTIGTSDLEKGIYILKFT